MKKNNNEVLELEAEEVSNNPLESVIEKELIKANVTDAVINALAEKYSGLKLRSIDDKEMYLEIKTSRSEVRKVGILVEKICKAGREDSIKIQKLWLSKEKEVGNKVLKVQDPLDAEIKIFEDEVARKEAEEKKCQEEAFIKRQSELLKYGAKYENGSFVLNHISYESINIQEADEEVYTDIILPKYRKQFEANEDERVEEENKRQEAALKLKQEQDELQRQRDEFKKQQDDFNKQKEEQERLRQEQQRKIEQQAELAHQRRLNVLQGHSFSFNYVSKVWEFKNEIGHVVIEPDEIQLMEDGAWDAKLSELKETVFEYKQKQKDLNYERNEKEKIRLQEEATIKERQRIEDEQKKQDEVKRLQELQKIEEAAKASDKEKWESVLFDIDLIKLPEFKSTIFKGKLNSLKALIEQIKSL